jgi:serine/threonine protein kinase
MAVQQERVKSIFADACEIATATDQAAFVEQACGADPQLLQEVRSLLTAHQQAGPFLKCPNIGGYEVARFEAGLEGSAIGSYRIVSLLGEGGFGCVFLAEQQRPIRRQVALKIIKLGMDTKQVIARFEVEQQAMALLEHPNIAKVFDAGVTPTGRPYFVMELVDGLPITAFCDAHCLSIELRVRLFSTLCRALQHAHDRGIVHRDIKPSNVLVSLIDGQAVPKVIDFGIAKAMSGDLADKALVTHSRQILGTPQYISPEQALIVSGQIDARADVYSLGVLLYELLTGVTPFDRRELTAAGLHEAQRIICEVEPPRPSTRVAIGAPTPAGAAHRRSEPRRLRNALRGDLDWIVGKCLEKQPARRYASAGEIAEDLARYLDHKPVLARPRFLITQLVKTIRRHRTATTFVAIGVVALATGIVAGSITSGRSLHSSGIPLVAPDNPREPTITPASVPKTSRPIDLLPLIDVPHDVLAGKWELLDDQLVASGGENFNRLQIPYRPTREYDFLVSFRIESGDGPVIQICPTTAGNLLWQTAWDGYGFEGGAGLPGGKRRLLQRGVLYESVVKVRKDRVQGYLDGTLITAFERAAQPLGLQNSKWAMPDEGLLAVAIWNSQVRFSRIQLVEIPPNSADNAVSAP